MSIPAKSSMEMASAANSGASRRRAATPIAQEHTRARRFRVPASVLILLALIVGMAIGALIMRQRYRARDVVVAVNGMVISKEDFFSRLQQTAGDSVLHQMVGEELQLQFAAKKGLAPTDTQVEHEYARLSKQPHFAQKLAAAGQDVDDFKHNLRVQMASAAVLGSGATVTDTDLHAFYNANIVKNDPRAKFYTPASVTVAVVRTPTEEEAQKALHDLATGIPFATVAKTYSTDASKDNGGVLAPILRGRSVVSRDPGLEETIFNMPIDGQKGPLKFGGSWWVIRCVDKTPEVTQPFEKVKDDCRMGALVMKGAPNARKVQEEFATFQKTANIQAFWPQYSQTLAVH